MTPSKRKLDVNVVQSNFHIEITPRYAHIMCVKLRTRELYAAR